MLVLAIGLLVLALPRLGASLAKLPGNQGVDLLGQGSLSADTLARVFDSREAARRWLDEPPIDYDLGLAAYGASSRPPIRAVARTLLREAIKDFRASLARVAGGPLCLVRSRRQAYTDLGDAASAIAMLEASYDFGPFMPEIAMMRTTWRSRPGLARPLRRLLAGDDFVQAMTREPATFVQLVVIAKFEDKARRALGATPTFLVQFEQADAVENGA